MPNSSFWTSLQTLGKTIRAITEEVWKVWRWLGASFVALAAYDRGAAGTSALVLGVLFSTIGVICMVGWFMEGLVRGLTEKGRNAGMWGTILTAFLLFLTAIFFAINLWAFVAAGAFPAHR